MTMRQQLLGQKLHNKFKGMKMLTGSDDLTLFDEGEIGTEMAENRQPLSFGGAPTCQRHETPRLEERQEAARGVKVKELPFRTSVQGKRQHCF